MKISEFLKLKPGDKFLANYSDPVSGELKQRPCVVKEIETIDDIFRVYYEWQEGAQGATIRGPVLPDADLQPFKPWIRPPTLN